MIKRKVLRINEIITKEIKNGLIFYYIISLNCFFKKCIDISLGNYIVGFVGWGVMGLHN